MTANAHRIHTYRAAVEYGMWTLRNLRIGGEVEIWSGLAFDRYTTLRRGTGLAPDD